jgi:ribosomal protein S18 acetylase RimI-like enzyme
MRGRCHPRSDQSSLSTALDSPRDLDAPEAAEEHDLGRTLRWQSDCPRCGDPATLQRVLIREFTAADWPELWPIVQEVVQAQETFTYDPGMTEEQAYDIWIEVPPGLTVVAIAGDRVVGSAKMGPNQAGPGSHISTAIFMVAANARGQGVGTSLCRFALSWATERGYVGMQFNAVAESNTSAVELYQRHGFSVIGTVPGAFAHPALGRIGLHVMYCTFQE